MASTPGRVSTVKDPSTQRVNDIHVFTKGLAAYRGDNSFDPQRATDYSAHFFTLHSHVAESQYGPLVLKFKLTRDIKLLRLDKNADGFHHWLQGTSQFSSSDKEILYRNFGYPKSNSESAISNGQARPRVSQGDQDRTMLSMIECYAQETGQEIDGYYNSTMANGALGKLTTQSGKAPLFHAELAVFDGQVFGQPKIASQLPLEQIQSLNMDAKRIRLEGQDRLARQSKKRSRASW